MLCQLDGQNYGRCQSSGRQIRNDRQLTNPVESIISDGWVGYPNFGFLGWILEAPHGLNAC